MARISYDDGTAAAFKAVREIPRAGLEEWREAIGRHLRPAPGMTLVDIGAGTGTFSSAFSDWFGLRVLAVEPSAAMRGHIPQTPSIQALAGDAGAPCRWRMRRQTARGSRSSSTTSPIWAPPPARSAGLSAPARRCSSGRRSRTDISPPALSSTTGSRPGGGSPRRPGWPPPSRRSGRRARRSRPRGFAVRRSSRCATRGRPASPTCSPGWTRCAVRDTTMRSLSDDEFERGKERLRRAIRQADRTGAPEPRGNLLDLLVLR